MPFVKLRKMIRQEEHAYLQDLIESGIDIKTLFERQGVAEEKNQAAIPNMKAVRKAIKAMELQNKLIRITDMKESDEVKINREKKKLLDKRQKQMEKNLEELQHFINEAEHQDVVHKKREMFGGSKQKEQEFKR